MCLFSQCSLREGSHLGAHARAATSQFKAKRYVREESGDEARSTSSRLRRSRAHAHARATPNGRLLAGYSQGKSFYLEMLVFLEGGKPENLDHLSKQREPTINSTQISQQARIKPRPHRWEARALTTAPSMFPCLRLPRCHNIVTNTYQPQWCLSTKFQSGWDHNVQHNELWPVCIQTARTHQQNLHTAK